MIPWPKGFIYQRPHHLAVAANSPQITGHDSRMRRMPFPLAVRSCRRLGRQVARPWLYVELSRSPDSTIHGTFEAKCEGED